MDKSWSAWTWRAVRITTLAVMATAIFFSALVLTTQVWNDFDLAEIVGRDTVSWTRLGGRAAGGGDAVA